MAWLTISGSGLSPRRRSPSRFIFSCSVVGRSPSAAAARRWFPAGSGQGDLDQAALVRLHPRFQRLPANGRFTLIHAFAPYPHRDVFKALDERPPWKVAEYFTKG